jgi:hypothetical protein
MRIDDDACIRFIGIDGRAGHGGGWRRCGWIGTYEGEQVVRVDEGDRDQSYPQPSKGHDQRVSCITDGLDAHVLCG